MQRASLIQKPIHGATSMDAETVFRLATIEGAKALHLQDEIGSIEPGKKADLVFMDLDRPSLPLILSGEQVYSSIVYSAEKDNVTSVMIDGNWVFRDGKSLLFDDKELFSDGKAGLKKLLRRVH
jgi:cytosine/adenosine deaminase-related metal-dependent hydrolase